MSKVRTPIRRVDSNHAEIIRKLRKHKDLSVWDTHTLGRGFPDIIVGHTGKNYLFEVKVFKQSFDPKILESKLTPDEIRFFNSWQGQCSVVNSYEMLCYKLGIEP